MTKSLRKNKALALYAFAFMASINLNAQATSWNGSTDTNFLNAANWSTAAIPTGASDVTITTSSNNPIYNANFVTVDAANTTNAISHLYGKSGNPLTVSATMLINSSGGNYTGGDFNIETGGSMNFRNSLYLGGTGNPSIVNVNGGSFNAKAYLIVSQNSNCTININSGTVSVDSGSGSAIIIGGYYAVGIVNLNGGTLRPRPSLIGTAALAIQEQPTRSGTGYLKIDGGTLEMGGDQTAFIDGYVTAGKIIPGTGKHIERTFLAATPGDATAVPPIPATTAKTLVTAVTNLGINKNMEKNFSVYPNPSNGIINIDAKNNNLDNLNISVYNLLGQQVLERVLDNNNSGTYRLDATNKLSSGTYIVNIKSGSSSYNSKIVVQ